MLSTTSNAPPACAISAIAAMSPTFNSGFVGVSIQTNLVLGVIAAAIASVSVTGAVDSEIQLDYFVYPGHPHNVRGKDRVHLMRKVLHYAADRIGPGTK